MVYQMVFSDLTRKFYFLENYWICGCGTFMVPVVLFETRTHHGPPIRGRQRFNFIESEQKITLLPN